MFFNKPCRTLILKWCPLQQKFFHASSLSFELYSITFVYYVIFPTFMTWILKIFPLQHNFFHASSLSFEESLITFVYFVRFPIKENTKRRLLEYNTNKSWYDRETRHNKGNNERYTYCLVKWWRLPPNLFLMYSSMVLFFLFAIPFFSGI